MYDQQANYGAHFGGPSGIGQGHSGNILTYNLLEYCFYCENLYIFLAVNTSSSVYFSREVNGNLAFGGNSSSGEYYPV